MKRLDPRVLVIGLMTLESCAVANSTDESSAGSGDSETSGSSMDAGRKDAARSGVAVTEEDAGVSTWMLNGPGNEAQAMATDSNGVLFFGQPSVRTLYPMNHRVPPPASWHVTYFQRYTSYAAFATDVAISGAIPPAVEVVVYDNEAWPQTPSGEQADPISYARRFAQLAHESGYAFMNTPAENLVEAMFPGTNKYLQFLTYGYAAAVAPDCEYYEIQGQRIENDASGDAASPSFDWFTAQVASQARSANPKVVLLGGLVAKPGYSSTDIVNAVHATRDVVSGYWLNILCDLDCTSGDGADDTKLASDALAALMTDHRP
jgi:hypothetical protein